MKVLLVNKFYYRHAGAEVYLLSLEEELKKRGHEVAIFSTTHPETLPTPWQKYFVPYQEFSRREGLLRDLGKFGNMIWSRRAARSFRALLRDFRPDVVHLQNIYHHISPSIISESNRAKIPVVQTLHDYKLICPNYTLFTEGKACERCHVFKYWNAVVHRCLPSPVAGKGSLALSGAAALEMWTHRLLGAYEKGVARFITPSAFLRDLLIRWGKDGKKIEHIPNLVDLSHLPPRSPEVGEGVLYVGRLEEWKGANVVLAVAEAAPDLRFRIAGSGALEREMRARLSALGLQNVTLLGNLSRDAVYEEMRRARVVVVPSLGYDPFPTTALEAGALGKPVVGSRVGGIPEIVQDGETGLLVTPGNVPEIVDAVRKLEQDSALALRLGASAERHVRALVEPGKHCERVVGLYQNVRRA